MSSPGAGAFEPEAARADVLEAASNRVVADALPGLATGLAVLQSVLAVAHAVHRSPIERQLVVVDLASVVFAVLVRVALVRRTLPERWAHPAAAGFGAAAIALVLIHLRLLADPMEGLMLMIVMMGAGSILLSLRWLLPLLGLAFAGWLWVVVSLGAPTGSRRVGVALTGSAALATMVLTARRRTFMRLEELRARDEVRRQELELAHRRLQDAFASLRESADTHRLLFDLGPLPAWVFDHATLRFLAVNDAAVSHYGYSRDEFLDLTAKDLRPPEDVPAFLEALAGDIAPLALQGTHRHRKKDGTLINVEVVAHDFTLGEGKAVLSILMDVTERRRAEEAMRRAVDERERMIAELREALATVKTLRGLIPICAWCKKVRDDRGYWSQVETYVKDRSEAEFSHGICPDCKKKLVET